MGSGATLEAFLVAVAAGDEDAALALCTDDGWAGEGDTAQRFYRQVAGRGYALDCGEERRWGDRSVARVRVRGDGLAASEAWVLARRAPGGWRVDGTASSWSAAGLYTHGRGDRLPSFAGLPESEAARLWAEAWCGSARPEAEVEPAAALLWELRAACEQVQVGRCVEVPGAGRLGAELIFAQPDGVGQTVWAVLEPSESGLLRLVGRSWMGSVGSLLVGLEPSWPPDVPAPHERRYSDEQARAVLKTAVAEALAAREGEDGLGARMAAALTGLFDDGLTAEPVALVGPGVDGGEPAAGTGATPTQRRVQAALGGAFTDYLRASKVDADLSTDDLRVDAAFVREHGGAVAASLVGAFAKALLPDDVAMRVVGQADEGDEAHEVTINLDLGDLFRGLFVPPDADG